MLFSYNLCPALGLLLLHERVTTGTYRRTILVGICLLLVFAVHPPIVLCWMAAVVLGAIVAAPALRDVQERQARQSSYETIPLVTLAPQSTCP